MAKRIKHYLLMAILIGIGYFFASQHIIIDHKDFWLLEKSYLTFEYTFYNITDKRPVQVMRIDLLREAGIGDVLVDAGKITELEKFELENKYD